MTQALTRLFLTVARPGTFSLLHFFPSLLMCTKLPRFLLICSDTRTTPAVLRTKLHNFRLFNPEWVLHGSILSWRCEVACSMELEEIAQIGVP
ncbi:hypothetical protein BJX63DRAFT_154057 [Aspergillus granulosus]|uniref:Secreted protein n=1 Tax=Aspergillus granulosus TaxID=176169 RepID=A0ABR4HMK8_9EURO